MCLQPACPSARRGCDPDPIIIDNLEGIEGPNTPLGPSYVLEPLSIVESRERAQR